ncbi:MAG: hypothetical protein II319_02155, partial [Clostridia bacterium]|nr:hypothetical protein [Clostridia bacterium]
MAAKVIRDYVPGQNDFLHFAEVMNKNAAIDFNNGRTQSYGVGGNPELNVKEFTPVNNTASVDVNESSGVKKPEGGLVPGVNNEVKAPSFTAPKSEEKLTMQQFRDQNGFLDEQGWYASQGLNPEVDLQNNLNAINYEYQTNLNTYGQRAEQLYQMGLSNSGVSDVFQANAFSSYLKAMNDSHLAYIDQKRKNKLAYGQYVSGFDTKYNEYSSAWDTEKNTNLNNALSFALENYNGYNLEQIQQNLAVRGYDQDIIDDVINRLGSLDATQLKSATALELVESIYTLMPNFTGSEQDITTIKNMLGNAVNSDALNEAIRMATAKYEGSKTDDERRAYLNELISTLFRDKETGASTYQGLESQKIQLNQYLSQTDLTEEEKEYVRNQLESNRIDEEQAFKNDTAAKIGKEVDSYLKKITDNGNTVSYNDYNTVITNLEAYKSQGYDADVIDEK